jgi:hypothetical protein
MNGTLSATGGIIAMAFNPALTNTAITPTVGAITVNGVASTVTTATNSIITPPVARRSGIVVPRGYDRIVDNHKLPRLLRAA